MRSRYPFREVKALMVLKGLRLDFVARKAGVAYTQASEILNGRRNDARSLLKLKTVIEKLEEVAA